MKRFRGGILVAMAVVLCSLAGCGERHEGSGPRLGTPPVAPMTEGGDGVSAMSLPDPATGAPTESGTGGQATDPPRAAAWPFRPTKLRLHPLTHALRSEDKVSVIEVRVEFFDRFDHTTKGLGVLHFELHATDGAAGGGPRLASWEIDVSDVDVNMRHYDDVTRTYLFRLGLGGVEDLPASGRLDVTAVTPMQQKMSGSIAISLR